MAAVVSLCRRCEIPDLLAVSTCFFRCREDDATFTMFSGHELPVVGYHPSLSITPTTHNT